MANYNWLQKVPDVRSCRLGCGGYHLPLGPVQDQVGMIPCGGKPWLELNYFLHGPRRLVCKTRWAWAWYHVVSHYIICDHFWRGESLIGNQLSFTYLHRWLTLCSLQASDPGRAVLWQRQRKSLQRDAKNHVWNCQRRGSCYFACLLNLTNCRIPDVSTSKILTLDPPRGCSSCGGVCCQLFTDMQFILVGLCVKYSLKSSNLITTCVWGSKSFCRFQNVCIWADKK